jgi:hypothetical protein
VFWNHAVATALGVFIPATTPRQSLGRKKKKTKADESAPVGIMPARERTEHARARYLGGL